MRYRQLRLVTYCCKTIQAYRCNVIVSKPTLSLFKGVIDDVMFQYRALDKDKEHKHDTKLERLQIIYITYLVDFIKTSLQFNITFVIGAQSANVSDGSQLCMVPSKWTHMSSSKFNNNELFWISPLKGFCEHCLYVSILL